MGRAIDDLHGRSGRYSRKRLSDSSDMGSEGLADEVSSAANEGVTVLLEGVRQPDTFSRILQQNIRGGMGEARLCCLRRSSPQRLCCS